jgi:hypothetical protein
MSEFHEAIAHALKTQPVEQIRRKCPERARYLFDVMRDHAAPQMELPL